MPHTLWKIPLNKAVVVSSGSVVLIVALLTLDLRFGERSHPLSRPFALAPSLETPASEYAWTSASTSTATQWLSTVDRSLGGLPPNASVIDVGCGDGSVLAHFRGRGWHLVGIDSSRSGIRIARGRCPDVRFEVADATEDLGFIGYGSFDAVISTDVIEHIFLPRKYAANCFRLLRPGGTLVISTPYHGYVKNLAIALTNKWDRHLQPLRDYGHIKFWSVDSLATILFEAGFHEVEWQGVGRVPHLWKDMLMTAHVPELDPPSGTK